MKTMNLPLVVSAMKIHSIQVKNIRNRCLQEAYLSKQAFDQDLQPNLTSSKVHLHKRKTFKSARKKVKKNSNRLEKSSKAEESNTTTVLCNKNKLSYNKGKSIPHRITKNKALSNSNNSKDSSSVIACSVRKLVSSYSNKKISTSPQNSWKTSTIKVPPRPKTSSEKKANETSEVKIKRQSCPPPLFQSSESSLNKNIKLKKVYYSEPQSQMLSGVPSVPPASPFNDGFVAVEIVPCLADIKSQQLIKSKLNCLVTKRQKTEEKTREKILKEEKRKEREELETLKQQHRAEIYALNEVMTEYERSKFLKFMKEKHNGSTNVALKV